MRELEVELVVNGKGIRERVPPRMHLADLLREKLRLTGTHVRCEQGVCGACTILVDGEPIRSCITYAAFCDGAKVTTIEGLDDDPIAVTLREAFSREHGLQCGFCTPGMLVVARDIIRRFPDADENRIRLELSGNLCRCTGYAGIVRAIKSVVDAKAVYPETGVPRMRPLAPVGSKGATATGDWTSAPVDMQKSETVRQGQAPVRFGLEGKKPNIRMTQNFVVQRPIEEVWTAFENIPLVAACLPGAHLDSSVVDDIVAGSFSAKLGPITASFSGKARIERDEDTHSGSILGGGKDARAGSRAAGEVDYKLVSDGPMTRVEIEVRALVAGPLAQFGRSAIMDDLVKRILQAFSENLERKLSGGSDDQMRTSLNACSLMKDALVAWLKRLLVRFSKPFSPPRDPA
jgi:aerobic carbon-monoxide dehydrogenase small subunit